MNPHPPRILTLLAACAKLDDAIFRFDCLPSQDNAFKVGDASRAVSGAYRVFTENTSQGN